MFEMSFAKGCHQSLLLFDARKLTPKFLSASKLRENSAEILLNRTFCLSVMHLDPEVKLPFDQVLFAPFTLFGHKEKNSDWSGTLILMKKLMQY